MSELAHARVGVDATYPTALRTLVDQYLGSLRFVSTPATSGLAEAMRYSLLGGGKRIRPVLALATAQQVGLTPQSILPLAAGIELIHTFSLIHDDLPAMDDDDIRRGRPTAHRVFGEGIAILAGDALFAEAFHHVLVHQQGESTRVLAALRQLAEAAGTAGLAGGQYIDLSSGGDSGLTSLRRMHELKTGRLLRASVLCVLALAHVGAVERRRWAAFAEQLGLLFQIVDDVLDVTASEDTLGKPRGSDQRNHKRTYVSELGIAGAQDAARATHAAAMQSLTQAAGNAETDLHAIVGVVYERMS